MADAAPTTLNVSLPEMLKKFVEAEVARRGFGSSSEYVRELIREAVRTRQDEILEEKLLEGMKGEAREMTDADWRRLHDNAERRHTERAKRAKQAEAEKKD